MNSCNRPGRKQKQIDRLTKNRLKTQYLFYCYSSLTPLFGHTTIRYFDLTFIYKKKVAFFSRQPFSLYNPEKLFSAQSLLMYYCLCPKLLSQSRVLSAFRKQCRQSQLCSLPRHHPNHRYSLKYWIQYLKQ